MATLTTDEYDPYQDAHTLPHRTQLQTGSSTLSPNRANFEKSALITESSSPETGRERNHTGTIILTGVLIVFAVALVVLGLLLQVFAVHVYHVADRAVYTTAPLGTTLAIAHLTSVVVGMSVPVTIGLAGYLLAGRWLEASRVEGRDRPNAVPVRVHPLGILMNTLSGANLAALWVSGNYIARRGVTPGGNRSVGRQCCAMLSSCSHSSSLSHTGSQAWKHGWDRCRWAVSYPVTKITSEGPFPLFGLRVNQTLCDETKDALFNEPYECGLNHGSSGHPEESSMQILTMNGLSKTTVIAFTEDQQTAIMVPPTVNLSDSLGWNATTLGVKSICTSGPLGPAGVPLNCTENPNATRSPVTYHYFNGSYTLLAREPSDLAQGQRIADGSWAGLYYVPIAVDGAGLYSGSYADAFSARLSLVTLATTVYVVEPVEALRMENTRNLIGSRLPLAPLLILFTLAFIYCVSVVMITVMAVTETQRSPLTAVARSRILDPATAISTAYGPEEAKRRATSTVHELFGHETAADRLTMGVDIGLPVVRRGDARAGRAIIYACILRSF
ncbi:hypothetical protein B0H14DRAFT_2696861 [Mycena olivaceomarginata]|nr:hypothetical protein B0H14DRAFT_2696861 [Mycena olivaceomarginata]